MRRRAHITSVDAPYIPWEAKTIGKMLWRGSPCDHFYHLNSAVHQANDEYRNGMKHATTTAWRSMQRHRISQLAHHAEGDRNVLVEKQGLLGPSTIQVSKDVRSLVETYFDVGLTGERGKPYFVSILLQARQYLLDPPDDGGSAKRMMGRAMSSIRSSSTCTFLFYPTCRRGYLLLTYFRPKITPEEAVK